MQLLQTPKFLSSNNWLSILCSNQSLILPHRCIRIRLLPADSHAANFLKNIASMFSFLLSTRNGSRKKSVFPGCIEQPSMVKDTAAGTYKIFENIASMFQMKRFKRDCFSQDNEVFYTSASSPRPELIPKIRGFSHSLPSLPAPDLSCKVLHLSILSGYRHIFPSSSPSVFSAVSDFCQNHSLNQWGSENVPYQSQCNTIQDFIDHRLPNHQQIDRLFTLHPRNLLSQFRGMPFISGHMGFIFYFVSPETLCLIPYPVPVCPSSIIYNNLSFSFFLTHIILYFLPFLLSRYKCQYLYYTIFIHHIQDLNFKSLSVCLVCNIHHYP